MLTEALYMCSRLLWCVDAATGSLAEDDIDKTEVKESPLEAL